jgi:hypothetical protein
MDQPLAVLVDGDNISGKQAAEILTIAGRHGNPVVVRVYLDARRGSDWHGALGYRMLHAGCGKNAADILLALDAMELALSGGMRRFVLASSDGDFSHLALRLRELGAKVIGIGEAKAPESFRASSTAFVELGARAPIALVPKVSSDAAALDRRIRAIIAQHSKNGAGMRITDLANALRLQDGVTLAMVAEKNWRAYLLARPALFELDPKGPDAMVRIRPQGFVQAA